MASSLSERITSLRHLIGDTKMLVLHCRLRGREHRIHAKYEAHNFTGSIKDRMALHILETAYAEGEIQPGDVIAEATSGNTGISMAAVGRALDHPVRIYMPDWMSRERVLIIQSLGAEVVPVSAAEGGFVGSIAMVEAYAAEHGHVFQPRQFSNPANAEAHRITTGPEILAQMQTQGITPTAFVAGVGTGGTVMGVAAAWREAGIDAAFHPMEPANSPTLREGHRVGKHRIQGISDEFVPDIVDLEQLDDIVDVWDGDAILMTQRLAAEMGLGLGISSGANVLAALQVADAQGDGAAVATILCDSNKKYLSTDLVREEPVQEGYLTPEVELLGCTVLPALGLGAERPLPV